MSHVRQQLRESVASALNGLTTTQDRVFTSRVYPLSITDLPCLIVTTDGDDIEPMTAHHPYRQQRRVNVRIEAYARATTDLDDTLDTICKEIEIALANTTTTAKDMYLKGTRIELDDGSEQPTGKATLIFFKDLLTISNAPNAVL